nr:aminotransferase class I/II-fold pyridoxal phosphate-dependent enzyme [Paraflavitalea speifideiaquila]
MRSARRSVKGKRYTILRWGDFDPSIFPIPQALEDEIVTAYRKHFTNYPLGEGNTDLREAIAAFLRDREKLDYSIAEILVASGGRPLIYSLFRAVCDAGDKVIYAVPSWNNNHYTHFVGAQHVVVEATAENNFMPTVEHIRPHLKGLLCWLCAHLKILQVPLLRRPTWKRSVIWCWKRMAAEERGRKIIRDV